MTTTATTTETAHNAAPVFTTEQIREYRNREQRRIANGTYTRLPEAWSESFWFRFGVKDYAELCAKREELGRNAPYAYALVPYTTPHDNHYAHVSLNDGARIAFTENDAKGVADRQTVMKPGKYLAKFFGDVLSPDEITKLATEFCAEFAPMPLQIAVTADDIEHIYTHGPGSCMAYKSDDYQSDIHPVRVYGDSDLQLAWIGASRDKVKARALIWPKHKRYGLIYGDETRLATVLRDAGYSEGSFRGARIQRIEHSRDGYLVMPYVDGISCAEDDGDMLVLGNGDIETQPTGGLTNAVSQYRCDECGNATREDELYYCDDDNMSLCECCDSRLRFHCDRLGVNSAGRRVEMENGETWSEVAFDCYGATCDRTGNNYPADEMVEMADGETWHQDAFEAHGFVCAGNGQNYPIADLVTLADGTQWCQDHFEAYGAVVDGENVRADHAPLDAATYRCPDTLSLALPDPGAAPAPGEIMVECVRLDTTGFTIGKHYRAVRSGDLYEIAADDDGDARTRLTDEFRAVSPAPEIHVGDFVECLDDCEGQFTLGRLYEVTRVYSEFGRPRLSVRADDAGDANGWSAGKFRLAVAPGKLLDGWCVSPPAHYRASPSAFALISETIIS